MQHLRITILAALALLTTACNQRTPSDQLAPATYRGLFPAADCPGIEYTLTLNDSIVGTDTLFALRMVYIEGDNDGGDITFDSRGRQQKFGLGEKRGYRLTPDDGGVASYFAIVNDTTLQMVDSTLTRIESPFNYDLVRTNL